MIKINFLSREGMRKLQRMSYMQRFNNAIRIHAENVAEHSFYVAMYAMAIAEKLGCGPYIQSKVIKWALVHDVSEIELSDIPHDVKYSVLNLGDQFEKFENDFNQTNFGITEHEDEKVAAIVGLADAISVLNYSKTEVEIGNNIIFGEILESTKHRVSQILLKLSEMFPDKSMVFMEILRELEME